MKIFASNFVSRYLAPGETFGGTSLRVQHLSLLERLMRKEIGQAITLVVEGSEAFDNLVRAVDRKMSGALEEDAYVDVRRRAEEAMADRYRLYAEQVEDPASLEQFTQIVRLLEDQ